MNIIIYKCRVITKFASNSKQVVIGETDLSYLS